MKILVTLDGSTFSESILAPVIQVAEATDSEVHLLTVVEEPGIRNTWIEALAMVDVGTGEFGVSSTVLPPMSQSSESGVATESNEQALERAESAAHDNYRAVLEREIMITLQDVQGALAPDEMLIEFFVGQDQGTVFGVTARQITARSLAITDEQLYQRVRAARDYLDRPGRDPAIRGEILQGLYDVLLSPVQTMLRDASALVIVPHGGLTYLPFSALIAPDSERYLMDDHEVSVLPSAAALVAL